MKIFFQPKTIGGAVLSWIRLFDLGVVMLSREPERQVR
jgi:hypothetical protein